MPSLKHITLVSIENEYNLVAYKPTHHSHTHWQAPQAETQANACQRVCLPNAEKKKLKISFPFKNSNSQADTKTLSQLVAKLNTKKGCKSRTTRPPACNSVYVAIAGEVVYRKSVPLRNIVLNGEVSASNPLLHIHANRCQQLKNNNNEKKSFNPSCK